MPIQGMTEVRQRAVGQALQSVSKQSKPTSVKTKSTTPPVDQTKFDPRKFLWSKEDIERYQKPSERPSGAVGVRGAGQQKETQSLDDWELLYPDTKPVPESIIAQQNEGPRAWYSRAYDTLSKSELAQQAKEYLIRQAKEKGPEFAAGLATTGAALMAGAGYAAHNKIKDWWLGSSEEKTTQKETAAEIDPYKQAFYAAEQQKIALANENIDKGNLEGAVKIIREQQTMWDYLPDTTKQDVSFERLVSGIDIIKQRLINTANASIEAILKELGTETIAAIQSKEDMAKIYFENSLQAGNWKGAENAIGLLEKEIKNIKGMSEKIAKLQHAIQSLKTIISDERLNSLIDELHTKIVTEYDQTAAQALLSDTEKSITTLKNTLSQAQQTSSEQAPIVQAPNIMEDAITSEIPEKSQGPAGDINVQPIDMQ